MSFNQNLLDCSLKRGLYKLEMFNLRTKWRTHTIYLHLTTDPQDKSNRYYLTSFTHKRDSMTKCNTKTLLYM